MTGPEKIKWLRTSLQMTTHEFGIAIGLRGRSAITKYEKGYRKPSFETLARIIKLAKQYNIKVAPQELRPL